jgi:hypothetical protein
VPLSDREQQILEQIERNLYQEDPGFARDVLKKSSRTKDVTRARIGAGLFILGLVTLFLFFFSSTVLVGVIAFGLMVSGIVLVAGAVRAIAATRRAQHGSAKDRAAHVISRWEDGFKKRYRKE